MMEQTGRQALPPGSGPPAAEDWERLQERWRKHARAIDAVAGKTRFGPIHLLDGTLGCRAAAFGAALQLVAVGDGVRSSPPEGFEVLISQEPTRPTLLGAVPLSEPMIAQRMVLALEVGGSRAEVRTEPGQTAAAVAAALDGAARQAALPVIVREGPGGRLLVQHRRLGSRFRFVAESSVPGVFSQADGTPRTVANGRDVAGLLHGEPGDGSGQTLRGRPENRFTAGLAVRYDPALLASTAGWKDGKLPAGRVLVAQQRLRLRWEGPEALNLALRLDPVRGSDLGRGEDDEGQVRSLADATTLPAGSASAALATVVRARVQVEKSLQAARAVGEAALPRHLARLQVQAQNLAAASQAITAPQLAVDAVRTLVQGLRRGGGSSLSAQNALPPKALYRLLEGDLTDEDWQKLN
jgi:hypothetical protein